MAGESWELIPSVLIVEILSLLSLNDRLNASAVCKRWRSCLFQPMLWKSISLNLDKKFKQRTNFLTAICLRFVRKCAVVFNPHDVEEGRKCMCILEALARNTNIQVLELKPSSNHFHLADYTEFRYDLLSSAVF